MVEHHMSGTALSTDLYEITMLAGYHAAGLRERASFELYARRLPAHRSFLIAAGLEQALEFLEGLRFQAEEIDFLRRQPTLRRVSAHFFEEFLPAFRFTGDVWAVPEGTPVFPPEPLMRVTAPLPEAQIVETALLAILTFQTSIASKAVRIVEAAAGRPVAEFGARRAHGIEAGVHAARAAVIAGCASTSNVEAGRRFGIALSGTMAHSWVMAFSDEVAAFRQFVDVFGDQTVLLLDTYDTLGAVQHIIRAGLRPEAVRLDSGDLVPLSRRVRAMLDDAGLHETRIFASGDLDEWRIQEILDAGAPLDAFGVGTALSTSSDAPALGGVYKLVEIERSGVPRRIMKRSPGKQTHPGRKQVWRVLDEGGAVEDVIGLADEPAPSRSRPLLERVMSGGRREQARLDIDGLQARCRVSVAALPASVRRLDDPVPYPVRLSDTLESTIREISHATEP